MEPQLENRNAVAPDPEERIAVTTAEVLGRWCEDDCHDAVSLNRLSPFDRIVFKTLNHTYEIVVASPEDRTVLVRGGAFQNFVVGRLVGSSFGSGAIKLRTIALGLRVELSIQGRWLITSPVETLSVVPGRASRREALTT
jgi:hypothetical protein